MTIFTKIKIALVTVGVAVIGILSVLLQRVTHQKKEAERERDTQIATNKHNLQVAETQSEIATIVLNSKKPIKKKKEKASKIVLPILFFALLSSGCTQTKYIATVSAPELYVLETGIELELVGDLYCINEEQAYILQQTLNGYKEQINKYNEWRLSNGKIETR